MNPATRRAYAEQHLREAAEEGFLADTSCTAITRTYDPCGTVPGLLVDLKRLKASLFPEFLSNAESGK